VQEFGAYLFYKLSYSKFSDKIYKFLLPWQQGLSEQSLTDAIKLANPENPILHASILRKVKVEHFTLILLVILTTIGINTAGVQTLNI